jgi:hypothetical protein
MRKTKPKPLTGERYVARFRAARLELARHYCTLFKFWRTCGTKQCRRARTCRGDQQACLAQRVQGVSRDLQFQARQQVLSAVPADAGPPELKAREFLPGDLAGLR